MAIDSWTSEGMDWSSPDALRMKPLYPYLEAIRLAIIERKKALGQSLIGIFAENYEIRLNSFKLIVNDIQNEINVFCNVFHIINYYNSLTEQYEIANGVNAFLNSISAEKRIIPSELSLFPEWIYQQYLLLNKMENIMIRSSIGSGWPNVYGGFRQYGAASEDSTTEAKETAIINYNNNIPTVYSPTFPMCIEGYFDAYPISTQPSYKIDRIAAKYYLNLSEITIQPSIQFNCKMYGRSQKPIIADGWNRSFDNCGLDLLEGVYSIVYDSGKINFNFILDFILTPLRPTINVPAPPPSNPPIDNEWRHQSEVGFLVDNAAIIYDFTSSFRFHA